MTTSGQVALAAALTAAGLVLAGCGDGQAARVAAESSLPSTNDSVDDIGSVGDIGDIGAR